MCGIIGIIGHTSVANRLIEGLVQLEYRGYDSYGIILSNNGKNILSKDISCLSDEELDKLKNLKSNLEIGHTRWATHGGVTKTNAHPHFDENEEFYIVMNGIIENLNIYPKNMLKNLNLTKGLFFSQRILLELTNVGFTREQSYSIVQENAMKSWKNKSSFYSNISNDKRINKKIPVNKLKKLFDFSYHTKKINIIFERSLK